jgi:hypothetical protein
MSSSELNTAGRPVLSPISVLRSISIRAVVVDPIAQGKLAIKPVELRDPDRDEVAVRVTAISLNRGETRRAVQQAEPGWRPGWDFAGVTETAAADGSGPKPGTRVVGILPPGAWAERARTRPINSMSSLSVRQRRSLIRQCGAPLMCPQSQPGHRRTGAVDP